MGERSEETFFWRHFPKNHLQEKMLNMNNHQGNARRNHKTHTCLDGYYQENKRLRQTEQRFLKKVNIELPCDLAIPFLTLCPKDLKSVPQRCTCIHMFTAAALTIAETREQPKCPFSGEWIKKVWCVHTKKCYSASEEILPFVTGCILINVSYALERCVLFFCWMGCSQLGLVSE